MTFIPLQSNQRIVVGTKLVLARDIHIPEGTILSGSVVTVIAIIDPDGKYRCKHDESDHELNLFKNTPGVKYYHIPGHSHLPKSQVAVDQYAG